MSTSTVDAKKRIVLPCGRPGDVYDIQQQDDAHVMLVRLERPWRDERVTRRARLEALRTAPLHPRMKWEELRQLTRGRDPSRHKCSDLRV